MHFAWAMKRIFLPLASMFSLLACVSATDGTSAPTTFDGQTDASDVLPLDSESGEEGEEDAERAETIDRVTPTEAFPTVAAFCVAQEKMMERASHLLRAAEERIHGDQEHDEEHDDEVRLTPRCEENRAVPAQTATFLSDPVRDISAVSYEVGEAMGEEPFENFVKTLSLRMKELIRTTDIITSTAPRGDTQRARADASPDSTRAPGNRAGTAQASRSSTTVTPKPNATSTGTSAPAT